MKFSTQERTKTVVGQFGPPDVQNQRILCPLTACAGSIVAVAGQSHDAGKRTFGRLVDSALVWDIRSPFEGLFISQIEPPGGLAASSIGAVNHKTGARF
jgi:hypothetical protein